MNDLNKITERDLNPDLLNKVNNPSHKEEMFIQHDAWDVIGENMYLGGLTIPENMKYWFGKVCTDIRESSFVNLIFDPASKEIALDAGVYENIYTLDGRIYLFSEELPAGDLSGILYYVQ